MKAIAAVLGVVMSLFEGLKTTGVVATPNPIEQLVIRDLEDVTTSLTDYDNGQAVVVGTFTESGVAGYIIALKAGGATAQALGL